MSRLYCSLVDAALSLEHLQPLLAADLETLRHPVDFGVDFLVCHFDVAVAAMVHDEPLVHEAFEHVFAMTFDASRRQGLAADVLAIDDRHHVVLGPFDHRQLVGAFIRLDFVCRAPGCR